MRISDLNKDVLAGRIKEECWQIMSEPGALSVALLLYDLSLCTCFLWLYKN